MSWGKPRVEYFFRLKGGCSLRYNTLPGLLCPALVNPIPDEKEIGLLFEAFNVPGICSFFCRMIYYCTFYINTS